MTDPASFTGSFLLKILVPKILEAVKAIYDFCFRKHMALIVLFIYSIYTLSFSKTYSLSSFKQVFFLQLPTFVLFTGIIIAGYTYLFIEYRDSKKLEISKIPFCSDVETDILFFSMQNTLNTVSRYVDCSAIVKDSNFLERSNMTIMKGENGQPTTFLIKDTTYNFLLTWRLEIENLMKSSKANTHIASKISCGSLIIRLENENNTLPRFRDAVSQIIKRKYQ